MLRLGFVLATLALAMAALLPAYAQQSSASASTASQNAANNPLTPSISVNLQDYFLPSLNRTDGRSANSFLLRGLVPAKFGGVPQLIRYTLPVVTTPQPSGGSNTGLGDLTLFDVIVVPTKPVAFGFGPLLVAPTASDQASGTGRWQAGAVGVVVAPEAWGLLASLVTYQHSFAGSDGRAATSDLSIQPIVTVNLPKGFYLRSTGQWSFDFVNGTDVVPVGLGAGKIWTLDNGTTINAFVEPQYAVFKSGVGVPDWQIFAGVNFQFPIGGGRS